MGEVTINVRMDEILKIQFETLCNSLGMDVDRG